MIDLHCHLLPGIDDGPATLAQSLVLARIALANGITHAVVTPHVHPGRYNNDRHSIRQAVDHFRTALQVAGIPLRIGFAGEVRLCAEVIGMVEQERIPYYGECDGFRIMLLEFPHGHIPPGSDKLVKWLLDHGIRPLLAHPERNKDVMRNVDKIAPFVEMGCLLQLTAASVAGLFGAAANSAAHALLASGCVTVLASDAHNDEARPPRLDHGRDCAALLMGTAGASKLVLDNPRRLVMGQFPELQVTTHASA